MIRWHSLALAVGSILAVLLLGEPRRVTAHPLVPGEADAWRHVRVDGVEVFTTTSVERAMQDVRALDELRRALRRLLPEGRRERLRPLRLVLFDRREHLEPFLPRFEGRPRALAGWFLEGGDRHTLVVDASRRDLARPVLLHEFVHAWIAANLPLTPLWVNEGLAEYHATLAIEDGVVRVGGAVPLHLETLRRVDPMPFERLFALGPDAPEYNETTRNTVFYAQSWAVVHRFLSSVDGRQRLAGFLATVDRGEGAAQAFEEIFGDVDPSGMSTGLRDPIRWPVIERPVVRGARVHDAVVEGLTPARALVVLGDLAARTPGVDPEQALSRLYAALELDPRLAVAWRGLALVHRRAGATDRALAALDRALALDPSDPDAHLEKGHLLVMRWQEDQRHLEIPLVDTPPVPLARARGHFTSALEARPDDPFALAGFGLTHLADRDPTVGIEALARARETLRGDPYFVAMEIVLRAHARDADGARDLLERDLRRRPPTTDVRELLGHAEVEVVNAEMLVVDRLVDDDRWLAAHEHLDRALDLTRSGRIAKYLRDRREGLLDDYASGASAESTEEADREPLLEAWRAALRGEVDRALARARSLATASTDPWTRIRAQALLEETGGRPGSWRLERRVARLERAVRTAEAEDLEPELERVLRESRLDAPLRARVIAALGASRDVVPPR